jgi:hypothetical protein
MSFMEKKPIRNSPFTVHCDDDKNYELVNNKITKSCLLSFSIGITAVVNESRIVSLHCCIDDCIRFQCHEIIVPIFVVGVIFSSALKLVRVQDFTNVFSQERSTAQILKLTVNLKGIQAYSLMFPLAWSPNPFFSVRKTSIGEYSIFWNRLFEHLSPSGQRGPLT